MAQETADGYFRKVTIILAERHEDIIDGIRKEIRSKNKYRFGRTEVIRALIDSLKGVKFDLSGIEDEEDLVKKFKQHIK